MMDSFYSNLKEVLVMTWPMMLISVVSVATIRIAYLVKHKENFVLYKDLLTLIFMLYVLCLFQIVTSQDMNIKGGNNFIPFTEIFRYPFGSNLFVKNIIGNVVLFMPYGFFASFYGELKKPTQALVIIFLASLSIECTQLAIGRIFDVDDILLNVLGGILGYVCYISLDKLGDILPSFFTSQKFLNFILIIAIIGIMVFFVSYGVIGR